MKNIIVATLASSIGVFLTFFSFALVENIYNNSEDWEALFVIPALATSQCVFAGRTNITLLAHATAIDTRFCPILQRITAAAAVSTALGFKVAQTSLAVRRVQTGLCGRCRSFCGAPLGIQAAAVSVALIPILDAVVPTETVANHRV